MPSRHTLLLFVALVLTGAAGYVGVSSQAAPLGRLTPALAAPATAVAATPTPVAVSRAKPDLAPTVTVATGANATPAAASSLDAATNQAVQSVIQQANQEQQSAFAKQDPTLMRDTATTGYYRQLVEINRDMADAGVTGIKLVKIEWGPASQQNATTIQATTFETWQTTYADGTSDQSRDRNVYTLVNQNGSWKIQADDHPDDSLPQSPSGSTAPSPDPGTVPPNVRPPSGRSGQSENWSGYAATGGNFTAVSGTWTVPQTSSSESYASGAAWVGIGGVNSRDLIQAGTEETVSGGSVRYNAWIEMLPSPSHPINLTVQPGDSVTVSIAEQGSDQWKISFKDNTTGKSYETTVQYTSSHTSAEWIEEAPFARRQVLPLDNFGTINFTNGSAVEDGKTVSIAQAGGKPVTMVTSAGTALAIPSALTSDGEGFSVSRTNASTSVSSQPGFSGGTGGTTPSRRGRGSDSRSGYPYSSPYGVAVPVT
ncbi:MAG TPA: G1 family glutamic endopeptidase [Chloroflexota bacterium]|nr:G1 family glutamic endopeptidase [Chloroflexota bacterium]